MNEVNSADIAPEVIDSAWSYEEYRTMIENLLVEGKTTGNNHSDALLHYTKMNVHRMKRHDKRTELNEEMIARLNKVQRPMIWLILTEAWCGDAAQLIPVIQKMADSSENIEVKLILRDENLDIMDQFLTNAKSRSIPKLICLDADTLEVLGSWGPRPEITQTLVENLLNNPDLGRKEAVEKLHKWYAKDKGRAVQKEVLPLLDEWDNK